MGKFKGTKDWEITEISGDRICIGTDIDVWCLKITEEEMNANAKLIADAGTTANKCGLLPSELLKQRDELLKALRAVRLQVGQIKHNWDYKQEKYMPLVDEAINNTK